MTGGRTYSTPNPPRRMQFGQSAILEYPARPKFEDEDENETPGERKSAVCGINGLLPRLAGSSLKACLYEALPSISLNAPGSISSA
jgi:hypothetical protein